MTASAPRKTRNSRQSKLKRTPARHASPLPPRKPSSAGKMCPRIHAEPLNANAREHSGKRYSASRVTANALKISKSAEKMPTHLPMVITAFDAPAFFEPFVLISKPFILAIIYDGLTLPTTYPPSTHSSSSTVFTFQMSCHGHFTMSMTGCQDVHDKMSICP